jgi:hypothetical protein
LARSPRYDRARGGVDAGIHESEGSLADRRRVTVLGEVAPCRGAASALCSARSPGKLKFTAADPSA